MVVVVVRRLVFVGAESSTQIPLQYNAPGGKIDFSVYLSSTCYQILCVVTLCEGVN